MTNILTLFNFEELRKDLAELSKTRMLAMSMRGALRYLTKKDSVLEMRQVINDLDREVSGIITSITQRYGVEFNFSGTDTTAKESQ